MDFDGDGILDILSGSSWGDFYVLRGLGKGKYAKRKPIRNKDGGYTLRVCSGSDSIRCYSQITAKDWENDGDLDLILGGPLGDLLLCINEGTCSSPSYSTKHIPIQAGGENAVVPYGSATPAVADWDGDGRWDILSGSGEGAVYWFRNVGSIQYPEFQSPEELIPKGAGRDVLLDDAEPLPSIRSQIAVVDYNGDGMLDLLVGDVCTSITPRADLGSQERDDMLVNVQRLAGMHAQIMDVYYSRWQSLLNSYTDKQRYTEDFERAWNELARTMFLTSDEADPWSRELRPASQVIKARFSTSNEMSGLLATRDKLRELLQRYLKEPPTKATNRWLGCQYATRHGYVWLFLRKEPVLAGTPRES